MTTTNRQAQMEIAEEAAQQQQPQESEQQQQQQPKAEQPKAAGTRENPLVASRKPVDVLKSMLDAESVQRQFKNALGENRGAFIASLIDLYTGDKQLQACKPGELIAQALKAATLKLPLNKALGFAYIVVYNNNTKMVEPDGRERWVKTPTPTFILGYKGYIQMAMRTGQYRTINADVVYEGELGSFDKLSGAITFDGERVSDKIVGYFCHFELLNGFRKTLYMTVREMAAYAKRYSPSVGYKTTVDMLVAKASQGAAGKQVGWEGNFNDMALKTVIRRLLSKYGYLSVEMQGALAADITADSAEAGRNATLEGAANSKDLDMEEADYEEVDTETGEIRGRKGKEAQAAEADPY